MDLASIPRRLGSQHVIAAGVAAAVLSVGLLSGGYSAQVRAAIALLTWWAVMLMIVLGVRPRAPLPAAGVAAAAALVGLAVLAGVSMGWADDDGRAFAETVRIAGYAGVLALVLLLSRSGGGRGWLVGLAGGLTAVACVALASRLLPSAFPEPDLLRVTPGVQNRLSHPVGYWNALGAASAMAVALLAWLQSAAAGRAGRTVAAALLPLPALALFFTSSRGGTVALGAGLVTLLLIERRRTPLLLGALPAVAGTAVLVALALGRDVLLDGPVRSDEAESQGQELLLVLVVVVALVAAARYFADPLVERARLSRPVGLVVAGAACVGLVVAAIAADLPRRVDEFNDRPPERQSARVGLVGHLGSSSGQGRYQLWQAAWDAFEHEPVRGIGGGGYEAWWTREGSIFHPARDAHSLYLETLAELGLLGGLLLAAFLAAVIAGVARAARRAEAAAAGAVVAVGLVMAGIDWVWEIPLVFGCVMVAAALLTGRALREPREERSGRRALALAAVAAAVAGGGVGLLSFVEQSQLGDSRAAAKRGDLDDAAEDAKRAHAAVPWAAAPWLQLALVEESRDLGAAVAAVDHAVEEARDDWRVWVVAARIRTRAGDVRGGARALVRAQTLNPRTPLLKD